MLLITRKLWLAPMILGYCGLGTVSISAQIQPPQAPTAKTPQLNAAPSSSAPSAAESAKKSAILASDSWKKLQSEFHEWLSVQVILTPKQVEQMKARLAAEVRRMSADDLEQFMKDWDAKLQVLSGQDAAEAREWLAQNLMVMADGYRKTFLKQLGLSNVVDMTAAQIEAKILEIQAKQSSMQQQNAAFNRARQQTVQNVEQVHAEWQQQEQQAAKNQGTAAQFNTFQSQYSPRPQVEYAPRYRPAYGGPFGGYGWGYYW
jgi:hypothetical protein